MPLHPAFRIRESRAAGNGERPQTDGSIQPAKDDAFFVSFVGFCWIPRPAPPVWNDAQKETKVTKHRRGVLTIDNGRSALMAYQLLELPLQGLEARKKIAQGKASLRATPWGNVE